MVFGANTERAIAALSKVASIWQGRLDGDWVPPTGSAFPWAQVRLSLAALLPGMRAAQGWVVWASGAPPAPNTGGAGVSATSSVDLPVRNDLADETASQANTLAPPVLGAGGASTVALILAGNTPLLAWSPLCACLLAGVGTVNVKLSRDETVWTRLFIDSLHEADSEVADRIRIHDFPGEDERTYALLQNAYAVIAYGSDAAVKAIRARTPEGAAFFGYGHAISIGFYPRTPWGSPYAETAGRLFARDVLMYGQQGCLSPHVLYARRMLRRKMTARDAVVPLSSCLAAALPVVADVLRIPQVTDAATAARVRTAREMALFAGFVVHGDDDLRWTVITSPDPVPHPEPVGHGVVYVSPVESPEQLRELLLPVRGIVSCAGVLGKLTPTWEPVVREAGVSRVCEAGEMQTPPLDWPNGNRDLLAELLKIGKAHN